MCNSAISPARPIIKDMTLEAKAGQTIALVGPTGAGKTTIINLLTRFYEIDGGQHHASTASTSARFRKADLRRQLGLVLQDTFLFSDTVMENIRYGRWTPPTRSASQAAEAGRCRSLHPPVAAGLPDAAFRAGQQPEPGAAPAAGHRPRHPGRPAHPDPGRSHQQRRHAHRGAHPESACCG